MEALCKAYWRPLFAFLLLRGHSVDDARDLTQGFFCELISKNKLAQADPERGRFRSFLKAMLKNFASNEWRKDNSKSRGGDWPHRSFHDPEIEAIVIRQVSSEPSPEVAFDRQWAQTVLARGLTRLEEAERIAGREQQFRLLRVHLGDQDEKADYQVVSEQLGVTRNHVAVMATRLRERYRDAIRAEIADTVAEDSMLEEEMRALVLILSGA